MYEVESVSGVVHIMSGPGKSDVEGGTSHEREERGVLHIKIASARR
jgi:hypothetical protein